MRGYNTQMQACFLSSPRSTELLVLTVRQVVNAEVPQRRYWPVVLASAAVTQQLSCVAAAAVAVPLLVVWGRLGWREVLGACAALLALGEPGGRAGARYSESLTICIFLGMIPCAIWGCNQMVVELLHWGARCRCALGMGPLEEATTACTCWQRCTSNRMSWMQRAGYATCAFLGSHLLGGSLVSRAADHVAGGTRLWRAYIPVHAVVSFRLASIHSVQPTDIQRSIPRHSCAGCCLVGTHNNARG